ncbi:hypothetical protein BDZ89DRAFT_1048853 [Hymenopellis radicata]|nr:hypothetical protein BDZ89DRAFT_1048853 [Hymenopellis radicata]
MPGLLRSVDSDATTPEAVSYARFKILRFVLVQKLIILQEARRQIDAPPVEPRPPRDFTLQSRVSPAVDQWLLAINRPQWKQPCEAMGLCDILSLRIIVRARWRRSLEMRWAAALSKRL